MKKPIIFIQGTGTYSNEIIVASGATQEQILKYCKMQRMSKDGLEFVKKEEVFEHFKKSKACVIPDEKGRAIILLEPFEDSWKFWEILIHELHHYTMYFMEWKNMKDEIEALAYLQEFLFHSIRRKLQKVDKI